MQKLLKINLHADATADIGRQMQGALNKIMFGKNPTSFLANNRNY